MTISELIDQAATRFKVRRTDIIGRSQERQYAWPRQWVMFEARIRGNSLKKIGRILDRDHTTIMHGIRAERARREASK